VVETFGVAIAKLVHMGSLSLSVVEHGGRPRLGPGRATWYVVQTIEEKEFTARCVQARKNSYGLY
jgi:hypothetical protein